MMTIKLLFKIKRMGLYIYTNFEVTKLQIGDSKFILENKPKNK